MLDLRPLAELARSLHLLERDARFGQHLQEALGALVGDPDAATHLVSATGPSLPTEIAEPAGEALWLAKERRASAAVETGDGRHILALWNGHEVSWVAVVRVDGALPSGVEDFMGEIVTIRREANRAGAQSQASQEVRMLLEGSERPPERERPTQGERPTLRARLQRFAAAARKLSGGQGALLVVMSRGCIALEVVGDGLLPVPQDDKREEGTLSPSVLESMCKTARAGGRLPNPETYFRDVAGSDVWLHPIPNGDSETLVLIAVQVAVDHPVADIETAIDHLGRFADVQIREMLQREALERREKLHRVAVSLSPLHEDIPGLVEEVGEIFAADVASLWLESSGRLYLAGTTDEHLCELDRLAAERGAKKAGPSYGPGEGLTGAVFERGTPLRLSDTKDPEQLRRWDVVGRSRATWAEADEHGRLTYRFLGVPLAVGERVVGVMRLSREMSKTPFSDDDEDALLFFGNLLGHHFDRRLERLAMEALMRTSSLSVMLSRQNPRWLDPDRDWPVVLANRGAATLFGVDDPAELTGTSARRLFPSEALEELRTAFVRHRRRRREEDVDRSMEWTSVERGDTRRSDMKVLRDGLEIPVSYTLTEVVDTRMQSPHTYSLGLARDLRSLAHPVRFMEEREWVWFQSTLGGKLICSSEREVSITGWQRDELERMNRRELFANPADRDRLIAAAQVGGESSHIVQLKHAKKDTFWVEAILGVVAGPDGKERLEGFYRDVTARMALQKVVGLPVGNFNITACTCHCLVNLMNGVQIASEGTSIDMGTLLTGNADDDNIIAGADFSILLDDYLQIPGGDDWNDGRCDFDRNGQVTSIDFSLLADNYNKTSPQTVE